MNNSQMIVDSVFPFVPNSAGDEVQLMVLALRGNKNYSSGLLNLAKATGKKIIEESVIENIFNQDTSELKTLLDHHGSDKARDHNYDILYAHIFKNRNEINNVLEIGLGTQSKEFLSHMSGEGYQPGSSIRAFKEYLPNANIYGADIDKDILFSEDRIKTFYVDQLDSKTLISLFNELPDDMDLIIDDGLHNPEANINVLAHGINKIKIGGWLVIEDIHNTTMDIWKVIAMIIPDNYNKYLLRARKGNLFAIQRLG